MLKRNWFIVTLVSLMSCGAFALPQCLDNSGRVLEVNNDQVLQWKSSTNKNYHARGHVQGPVTRQYADETGHTHFEMQIGNSSNDTIEIIYNQSFGALPDISEGMTAEVCGDYITTGTTGRGASPDGAIIHWVHTATGSETHPSGYVALDGVAYGDGNGSGDMNF